MFIVAKDGQSSDLTFRRYSAMEAYTCDEFDHDSWDYLQRRGQNGRHPSLQNAQRILQPRHFRHSCSLRHRSDQTSPTPRLILPTSSSKHEHSLESTFASLTVLSPGLFLPGRWLRRVFPRSICCQRLPLFLYFRTGS